MLRPSSITTPVQFGHIWAQYRVYRFVFPLKSLKKKNIVTKQMKNEYFQENKEKSIEYTREMILSDDPNEIIERKTKTKGK